MKGAQDWSDTQISCSKVFLSDFADLEIVKNMPMKQLLVRDR